MARSETQRPRSTLHRLGVDFAHLAALSAFAVAQPLFDLLGSSPDFFAVRGSTRWDIVLFALGVVLIPPAVLIAVEAVARLVSPRLQRALHLVFVAALAGVVIVQALERSVDLTSTAGLVGLTVVLAAAVTFLYWRLPAVRSLLTVLALAPAAFLAYFLLVSPVSELTLAHDPEVALAGVSARAPVVLVVFDEFPVSSLLDGEGRIDAERYPNFAALAQSSTWFRHASTVSYSTTQAVPAILTGQRPHGDPPIFAGHPRNLFTLLGGAYRMNVVETYTSLCPEAVCRVEPPPAPQEELASLYSDAGLVYLHLLAPPRLEEKLTPITGQWMSFGRDENEIGKLLEEALKEPVGARPEKAERYHDVHVQAFQRFLASIEPGAQPSLNFIHIWFPHAPWSYFPSGSQSSLGPSVAPGRDGPTDTWEEPSLTLQAYQRHLLQVGFTDRLLGELLDRLRRLGTYDESLVVVTADHGVSFRPGASQRGASQANLEDIAFVPLFVKEPGQQRGAAVDYHVQTIDVLPTIADVLGIGIPWSVDGRTALRDPGRDVVAVHTGARQDADREATAPFASLVPRQEEAVRRRVELFGVGDWERLFATGQNAALRGRAVSGLPVSAGSGDWATITNEATRSLLGSVDADLPFVPSPLQGEVGGGGARVGRALAVSINGRIRAFATVYRGPGGLRFSALPPESAFRNGRNVVELFWVDGPAGSERLTPLESR